MPRTRADAVAEAGALIAELSRRIDVDGGARIAAGGADFGLVQGLAGLLTQRVADVLQGATGTANDPLDPKQALYDAREWLRDRATALRGFGRWPSAPRSGGVLAIPRTGPHLRDMLPVSARLRASGAAVSWVTFRRDHAERARGAGEACVLAAPHGHPSTRERLLLRARLLRATTVAARSGVAALSPETWAAVVATVAREAHAQLDPALVAARSIARAFEETAPRLAWIGNPATLEGTIARLVAGARGVPTAVMQHGDIAATQREWAHFGLDRITVWGPAVRERLIGLGVPADRVVVTGAPWVDRLVTGGVRVPRAQRRILIALSGAGNFVGQAEHQAHVEKLIAGAAALPQHRWSFRLHPKDGPALYERLLAATPAARADVVPAAQAPDIHQDLAESDLLVTVTSTSALDAMLEGVPVLTLGRPEGEPLPAFVRDGATRHVEWDEPLVPAVEALLAGADPALMARAHICVEASFGPLDGRAGERVADVLRARLG